MDTEDVWFYYRDEAYKQIGLAMVMRTAEIVCSTLQCKLGQTWESYLTELPKLPWTSLYLTSLELENYDEDICKNAYCMLLIMVFVVLKRVVWKSTKMITLKKL